MFEKAWEKGGGFRFAFEVFNDIFTNEDVNNMVQDFIRRKIATTVQNPEIARTLSPTRRYAQRPICDSGYYKIFNRENVSLVDIQKTPIQEITENGIRTQDGVEHDLDVIIFATGYDGVVGSIKRVGIYGRGGRAISEAWKDEPLSYLGMVTNGYPNMFMLSGPNSPFTNIPPLAETQVNWIADLLDSDRAKAAAAIEATAVAEKDWLRHCCEVQNSTFFATGGSWFVGANIPGKKVTSYFNLEGFGPYRDRLESVQNQGYPGMQFT